MEVTKNPFKKLGEKSAPRQQAATLQAKMPSYAVNGPTRKVKNMISITKFKGICEKHPAAPQMQDFLSRVSFQGCEGKEEGTTWLELYVLYKLAGGLCPVRDPEGKASARPAMRVQLKMFQNICRYIIKNTMTEEDAGLFKQSKSALPRLKGHVISTRCAMVNARVKVTEVVQQEIAYHIIRSQANRSSRVATEIMEGKRFMKLAKFASVRKTGWSRTIPTSKNVVFEGDCQGGQHLQNYMEAHTGSDGGLRGRRRARGEAIPVFACGTCGLEVKANRKAFKLDTLGDETWCNRCRKNYMSKTWVCGCNKLWYLCETHGRDPGEEEEEEKMRKRRRPARTGFPMRTYDLLSKRRNNPTRGGSAGNSRRAGYKR